MIFDWPPSRALSVTLFVENLGAKWVQNYGVNP